MQWVVVVREAAAVLYCTRTVYSSRLTMPIADELKIDTTYHIVLSAAILLKIVFIACAVINFYDVRSGRDASPFAKKVLKLKDITNELVKGIVCALMLFLFYPRNKNYCIDRTTKMILFSYAVLAIVEINWAVFAEPHPAVRYVQFFLGRIGTMRDQQEHNTRMRHE